MTSLSLRQQIGYAGLLFGALLPLMPRAGHPGDSVYWVQWASYSLAHGLGNIYQVANNNYNPLYHYVLWAFGKLMGSPVRIEYYHHWLKVFTLLFDFAGAFWAASLVAEKDRRFGLVLLLLFNIGYLYNTLIWGQIDAMYTFFAFGAVVLAARQRSVASVLCYVLALLTKTQAIIFLPPLLLLWAPLWWRRPAKLGQAVLAGAALTTLVLAPFIWGGDQNYLPRIIAINLTANQTYPIVAMGAYNLWHLLPGKVGASDLRPLAGLTYRAWGLLLFCTSSALVLLPLLLAAGRQIRIQRGQSDAGAPTPTAESNPDLALILLSCGLIPLVFSYFNTQMHERYWHAAVLFLAAYGFVRRDYLPYLLVSVAYFLNLENLLRFLPLKHNAFFFKSWFSAVLFTLSIVICLVKLYRLAAWRFDWQRIRQQSSAEPAGPLSAHRDPYHAQ